MALPPGTTVIDRGYDAAIREMERLAKFRALVGWPGDGSRLKALAKNVKPSVKSKKTKRTASEQTSKLTVAEIAFIMEYGSVKNNLPPRPIMAQTIARTKNQLVNLQGRSLDSVLAGKVGAEQAMKLLALWFEGELKRSFVSESFVGLSSSTIARKGSTRPLIDTGQLRQSITSKVIS